MDLNHEFTVSVPVDEAWNILTDVERIAPCLPGAELQEVEGDTYRGVVKVKVGPIQAQFKGQASFVERDDTAHRAVLKGEGRDTGGKGNASALITAELTPAPGGWLWPGIWPGIWLTFRAWSSPSSARAASRACCSGTALASPRVVTFRRPSTLRRTR